MNGIYSIAYKGNRATIAKTGDIKPQTAPSGGNQDDRSIHHPAIGQMDTAGNRFAAILKACSTLHRIQAGDRYQTEARLRAMSRLPALKAAEASNDLREEQLERRRREREIDALFGDD